MKKMKNKNNKRMCVAFFIIEQVYWCSRVTLLSMFVDGSSYMSFPRPFILCIHFFVCFESEMNDLLLGALGHCPFHHCIHYWCDFPSYLIWVDHHSFSYSVFRHHPQFCFWFILFISPLILFLQRPILGLLLSLHHFCTSHYQFNLLHLSPHWHYIHVRFPQVHGSRGFLYMLHFIYEGMSFWLYD